MKKILSLFLPLLLLAPFTAQAMMVFVSASVTIVENTTGGDGNFGFHLTTTDVSPIHISDFSLQTVNSTASFHTTVGAFSNTNYYISQDEQAGWQLTSATCSGTDPANTGSILFGQTVQFTATPYATITCVFNNTKVSSKTPILIVPGLFGTELYKGSTRLWADIGRMVNPFNDDSFLDPLQFNNDLTPLDTSVTLGGVIREATSVPETLLSYDYTKGLIDLLTSQPIGYTEGKDLFTFSYDWRFGVSDDAVNQLKGQIDYITSTTGSSVVDIIAHSTGGLIVKKYVMEHPTDHHIGKAVFVGVPNLGAPKALKVLLEGDNFGIPGLSDSEMQKIAKNMPVTYDLAPGQEYYNSLGSFMRVGVFNAFSPSYQDLAYSQTADYLKNHGFNSQAIDNAANLRSADFDNYDVRTDGVDAYNIVGCKTGTLGKLLDLQDINGNHLDYDPNPDHDYSGDGTVPFGSADSVPADPSHVFFAPQADHGKMPSADGIRQEIVNIFTGSSLSTNGKILTHDQVQQNPALCQIKGEELKIKSPVGIGVTDQDGNFSGIASDGSIQNDIQGADYEVWGQHKYVFLPTDGNQQYQINLKGTGSGTFTLDDESISGDAATQTQVFSNLPVTTALTGSVTLGATDSLSLDTNGDGTVDQTVQPSSVVNANQSLDTTPPVSTSTISGTMGDAGFYRSDVKINLSAADPVVDNNASTTSGVLKIQYSLDNGATTTYQSTIVVATETPHTLSFFSTDKAGNNEAVQTISFSIDKTAPEFLIQFSPSLQDLVFTATDTLPTIVTSTTTPIKLKPRPPVKVVDQDNIITATDAAGNTTQITLKDKNRKKNMQAQIQSLNYNGTGQDISKNTLAYSWSLDKTGNLKSLIQNVAAKKTYNILAIYDGKNTSLVGIDKSGIILKSLKGLDLLTITTAKGDLAWGY